MPLLNTAYLLSFVAQAIAGASRQRYYGRCHPKIQSDFATIKRLVNFLEVSVTYFVIDKTWQVTQNDHR